MCSCERLYKALVEEAVNLKGIWKRMKIMTCSAFTILGSLSLCAMYFQKGDVFILKSEVIATFRVHKIANWLQFQGLLKSHVKLMNVTVHFNIRPV